MEEERSRAKQRIFNLSIILGCISTVCLIAELLLSKTNISFLTVISLCCLLLIFLASIKYHFDEKKFYVENSKQIAQDVIMSHASHDLRSPMNAIINFSDEEIIDIYDPKEMRNALAKINDSGRYMMTLINDLLTMANESQGFTLHEECTTIASCIEPALEMTMGRFNGKNQIVTIDYVNLDKYRYVLADAQRTKQIIMNLLSNATKYTDEGGRIEIIVENTSDSDDMVDLRLHIRDTGMGMSSSKRRAILRQFKNKTFSNSQELGLGLSTIFTLVDAMKGDVDIVAKEGRGTEFIISLKWPYTVKQEEEATHDYSILNGKNVLLVEDNTINAEIAQVLLSNKGITLDLAQNGEKGVAMFTHAMPHTYDAILMDIKMPVMDGYEATRKIRKSNHPEALQIPIIAMTAEAFDEDREKSLKAGMNAHITKPITPEELYAMLSNFFSRGI